jgi:hypothetical protein
MTRATSCAVAAHPRPPHTITKSHAGNTRRAIDTYMTAPRPLARRTVLTSLVTHVRWPHGLPLDEPD